MGGGVEESYRRGDCTDLREKWVKVIRVMAARARSNPRRKKAEDEGGGWESFAAVITGEGFAVCCGFRPARLKSPPNLADVESGGGLSCRCEVGNNKGR